jgi:hypothetical protein
MKPPRAGEIAMPTMRAKVAKLALDNPGPLREALVRVLVADMKDLVLDNIMRVYDKARRKGEKVGYDWQRALDGFVSSITNPRGRIVWINNWPHREPWDEGDPVPVDLTEARLPKPWLNPAAWKEIFKVGPRLPEMSIHQGLISRTNNYGPWDPLGRTPMPEEYAVALARERGDEPWPGGYFNPRWPAHKAINDALFQLGWGGDIQGPGEIQYLLPKDIKFIEMALRWLKKWGIRDHQFRTLWNPFFIKGNAIADLARFIETGDDTDMDWSSRDGRALFEDVGLRGAGSRPAKQFSMIVDGLQRINKEAKARAKKEGHKYPPVQEWWYAGT